MRFILARMEAVTVSTQPVPPFRWDVSRRSQLGRLLAGWQPTLGDEFVSELPVCAARVVSLAPMAISTSSAAPRIVSSIC